MHCNKITLICCLLRMIGSGSKATTLKSLSLISLYNSINQDKTLAEILDQVHSNIRVSTQVNTSQHESTQV